MLKVALINFKFALITLNDYRLHFYRKTKENRDFELFSSFLERRVKSIGVCRL